MTARAATGPITIPTGSEAELSDDLAELLP
jgi:hypothetical protein